MASPVDTSAPAAPPVAPAAAPDMTDHRAGRLGALRQWCADRPWLVDGFVFLVLATGHTLYVLSGPEADADEPEVGRLFWVLGLLVVLPALWRRRRPGEAVMVSGLAITVIALLGYDPAVAGLGAVVAVYSVAAYGTREESGSTVVIASAALLVAIASQWDQFDAAWDAIAVLAANYLIFGTAWLLGDNQRRRRERVAELEARAQRLEREQERRAQEAVRAERIRIARDLHDVVAHSMSVMTVQAGAARRVLERGDGATASASAAGAVEVVAVVERTGREALAEMRRLLGVLRDDEDGRRTPQPGLADLDALVAQFRDTGLDVTADVDVDRTVSPGLELSVYRIVQEALTNVLRHAGPAVATVTVATESGAVRVEVSDDGRGAAAEPTGTAGHGITGMRERAALFDGDVTAGPRPGGGFRVVAHLPIDPR